jgi:hypothetical protein
MSLSPSNEQNSMSQQTNEEYAVEFWPSAIGGAALGLIIGTLNRGIVTALLSNTIMGYFVGFGVGGLIAGAIQGAMLRRYIPARWLWICISGLGWLMLGIPNIWLPRNPLSYWACDSLLRWMLIGALGGAVVGALQSLVLRRYLQITWWWIGMHMLVWAALLALPIVFFESLLRGEGSCYY